MSQGGHGEARGQLGAALCLSEWGMLDNTSSPAPAFCCSLGAEPQQSPDVVSPSFGHSSTGAGAEQVPIHQGIREGCP